MERHRCKLCFRIFANGRALGGHMRSHMMNFYSSKNASNQEEEKQVVYSDENVQEDDVFQSVDSYLLSPSSSSSSSSSSEVEDNPFRRRSKKVRKSRVFYSNKFAMSSISDTTPDEDVAYCLMMLSRDKWRRKEEKKKVEEEDDDSHQDSVATVVKAKRSKVRGGKYRCETCNKLFRSYQALGGHRASHKKIKANEEAAPPPEVAAAAAKVHECPFCQRVFSSGQALGGHKRSHFIGAAAISANNVGTITSPVIKTFSRIGEGLEIDLNLPAPVDDDDES